MMQPAIPQPLGVYRAAIPARWYVCPACYAAAQGPLAGGPVACTQCGTQTALPPRDLSQRSSGPAGDPNDPARLAQLRMQDGRARHASPGLVAVLGGESILPGREREAMMVWQQLRQRAASGDPGASEDMTVLTMILTQHPAFRDQALLVRALVESALDASVLPRHRQEHLATLCRRAVSEGHRDEALQLLHAMDPMGPELDSDSQYRVSAAAVATLERDGRRVLWVLGERKDAVPIADHLDPMASVFRANAYELLGQPALAAAILHELPSLELLALVQGRFPDLRLCAQSGTTYSAAAQASAADRAGEGASNVDVLMGRALFVGGVFAALMGVASAFWDEDHGGAVPAMVTGAILFGIGLRMLLRGRTNAKKARWLMVHGIPLRARIVGAELTGTSVNDVPVMRIRVEVAGASGPYPAMFTQLTPQHEAALLVGKEIRVRANPQNPTEIAIDTA